VSVRVVSRSGGSGEDELALFLAVVDLPTDAVPDLRLDLPFVEQDRWPSGEEGLGVEIELGARYGVLVEADDRVGDLGCSGGLSARLRPLDEDCAHHA
jgi:hypothetical protein